MRSRYVSRDTDDQDAPGVYHRLLSQCVSVKPNLIGLFRCISACVIAPQCKNNGGGEGGGVMTSRWLLDKDLDSETTFI